MLCERWLNMSFLSNNMAVIAVAAVASVLVWVFGGTRGDLLTPIVPWLFVIMVEVLFFFPQRHRTESTYEARERVWRSLKHDPVVWVSLGLLALLSIPFVNNGLCPFCDYARIAQGIDPEPPAPFLPFCVSRLSHLNVFWWFLLSLSALVLVRDGLTRRGKRLVLEMIMWNGAAVAVFGFVQAAMGAPGPFWDTHPGTQWGASTFFATFGYPNMAGDYFTTMFVLAAALWRNHIEQVRQEKQRQKAADEEVFRPRLFWKHHYFLIPAALFFFAALNTLSRAAIILVTTLAVLFFVHTLVCILARQRKSKRVVLGVWSLLAFGVIIFFSSVFMPENIKKEVDTLGTIEVLDRVTGRQQNHEKLALALWRDNKLFGCGGWGYAHLCQTKMTPQERRNVQTVGGANVHNDCLQFLTEHGLVGFGAMVALVVLLFWPIGRSWKQLVKESRFKKDKEAPPRPRQIFVLPAPVFFILLGCLATLIHSLGDCPLRSPAILLVFFVNLAALPGFMSKGGGRPPEEEHHHHHHHHHSHH